MGHRKSPFNAVIFVLVLALAVAALAMCYTDAR